MASHKECAVREIRSMGTPLNIIALTKTLEVAKRIRDDALPFNLQSWMKETQENNICSTVACVVGWCTRDEWFRKAGLVLRKSETAGGVLYPYYEKGKYCEEDAYGSLRSFYGIGLDTVMYLFIWHYYVEGDLSTASPNDVTIDMVISRLEDFLLEAEKVIAEGLREPVLYPKE